MDRYFSEQSPTTKSCKPLHSTAWDETFFKQFSTNQIPSTQIDFPPQQPFDSPEMIGSIQRILASAIGTYVVIEFLIGTEAMMRKQGILYLVGTSYVTLYDDVARTFITCDLFAIKFVYYYYPGDRPKRNYNALPPTAGNGR